MITTVGLVIIAALSLFTLACNLWLSSQEHEAELNATYLSSLE